MYIDYSTSIFLYGVSTVDNNELTEVPGSGVLRYW